MNHCIEWFRVSEWFEPTRLKIVMIYISFTALEISRNIFCLTECNSYTLVVLVNFPGKKSFGPRNNLDENHTVFILMIFSLRILSECYSMMGCIGLTRSMLIDIAKKFFFGEIVTRAHFGSKLWNLLSQDLFS